MSLKAAAYEHVRGRCRPAFARFRESSIVLLGERGRPGELRVLTRQLALSEASIDVGEQVVHLDIEDQVPGGPEAESSLGIFARGLEVAERNLQLGPLIMDPTMVGHERNRAVEV